MRKNKKGFLLFEVLLSLVILAGGLLLVMQSFLASKRVLERAGELWTATLFLEKKMWDFEVREDLGEGLQSGVFGGGGKFAWDFKSARPGASRLKQVTLAVFRKDGRTKTRYSVSTYLESGPDAKKT